VAEDYERGATGGGRCGARKERGVAAHDGGLGPGWRRRRGALALIAVLLVAPALAVGAVGLVALPIGTLLAAGVWLRPPRAGITLLGALGGLVCAYNAGGALALVGGAPVYETRVGLGWLALGLGVLGLLAALGAIARPRLAGGVLLLASIVGFVAINLFYINTLYDLGSLLLAAAGLWALVAPGPRT
jgi:hypothetical protein